MQKLQFDQDCTQCPRLARHLQQVKNEFPAYHALPVAPFGVNNPKLLIIGLAPGMHGANATGRPFTGDYAGILLYQTLYKYGFSNKPESVALNDGLKLKQCKITNAVKCLPPENKPTGVEVNTCNNYLASEIASLKKNTCILVLGGIAHKAALKAMQLKIKDYPFMHGGEYILPNGLYLYTSYHCSRYNTQTNRLTEKMFHDVFKKIRRKIDQFN
jgi:uracil-DNA glycosylase family 4